MQAEMRKAEREAYARKKAFIDFAEYRDYFPELKVGIKDEKTGRFYETRADDVFKVVMSEFHDMYTRRTWDELQDAGLVSGDLVSLSEFGPNFNSRGFRYRALDDLELLLDEEETMSKYRTPPNPLISADSSQLRRKDRCYVSALRGGQGAAFQRDRRGQDADARPDAQAEGSRGCGAPEGYRCERGEDQGDAPQEPKLG